MALLCRHPGCTRNWTSSFGPYPACDEHKPTRIDTTASPAPSFPTRQPVKPWADNERNDE